MVGPPLPFEACVGLMNPEVPFWGTPVFSGGLAAPTELPLDEDLDAGILTTGFGTGFGAGFCGAGAFRTVATDAELFNELLELRREALEVDLSTRKELARLGTTERFGSRGVRGGVRVSLVDTFIGTTGDLTDLGVGESHSTLHPEDAPCDALSELRLCVSSNPSSLSSCSLFTFGILGDVVLSGSFSVLCPLPVDFL